MVPNIQNDQVSSKGASDLQGGALSIYKTVKINQTYKQIVTGMAGCVTRSTSAMDDRLKTY